MMRHHLIVRPRSAFTACGLAVDVFMPGSGTAYTFKPSERLIMCTVDEGQATCLACHHPAPAEQPEYEARGECASAADQAKAKQRASVTEHVTIPERPALAIRPAFVPDGHRTFEHVLADEPEAQARPARCAAAADSLVSECKGATCKAHGRCCWE